MSGKSGKEVFRMDMYYGLKGKIVSMLMNFLHRSVHSWFVGNIAIAEDSRILDVGCGGGSLLALLSGRTGEVTFGIDYSEDMIKASKKKNKTEVESGKISLQAASASRMPFEENSFDIVTAFETVQYWPDLIDSFIEVRRVLAQGGKFCIMNRMPPESSKWYEFCQLKTPQEYKEALGEAGFAEVSTDTESREGWIVVCAE